MFRMPTMLTATEFRAGTTRASCPRWWLVLLLSAAVGSCDRAAKVEAPEPARNFAFDADSLPELPPLPPGTIVAPIALDAQAAIRALEKEVPTRFGDIEKRLPIAGSRRRSFAFEVTRSPFTVAFRGDTVLLSAVLAYKGRGWYDPPIGPDLNGECGTKGPPPRAQLNLRVVSRLSADWRLRIRAQRISVTPLTQTERDQCEVSFLNLDVTGKVMAGAEAALRGVLPIIERQLGRLDVRSPLEKIWVDLQQPIRITDSLWLLLQPKGVYLGKVKGAKETVGAEVGISAAPRIMSGRKPVIASIPLPPLEAIRETGGFSMLVEATFDYRVMSAVLSQKLRNMKVRAGGGELIVKRITVFGVGRGRLALGLEFGGTAQGRVWFQGTPRYDVATGILKVPDLDFDATSADLLVQGVAWLKGDDIREFLRTQATFSTTDVMKQVQDLAVKEMNTELARGVRLSVVIDSSEPAGLRVLPDHILVRARASGTGRLDLGPEIFAPKPPASPAESPPAQTAPSPRAGG
jgi:hypothetical protein